MGLRVRWPAATRACEPRAASYAPAMSASEGFLELLKDAMAGLGPIAVRRMFGGAGIFCDGVMLGLVADDTLYLKADAATRAAFEAEGLGPFTFRGKAKTVTMSYWRAPERLLDDPDEMAEWAGRALTVARAGARRGAKATSRPQARSAPGPAPATRSASAGKPARRSSRKPAPSRKR